jgi:ribosomal protein L7Ae-like RNA K-turn-binding protein
MESNIIRIVLLTESILEILHIILHKEAKSEIRYIFVGTPLTLGLRRKPSRDSGIKFT